MEKEIVTDLEGKLLEQFRIQIEDLGLSEDLLEDKNLVRWIRARNNKLKDAESMIRKHLEWRKEVDIEKLVEFYLPPEWDEYYAIKLYGFNPDGCPVFTFRANCWDIEKGVKAGIKEDIVRHSMAVLERVFRICVKNSSGRGYMSQFISIYDLSGLRLSQFNSKESINTILQVLRGFEANYPEIMRRIFILNAPWIFQILWKLVCQILSERSASKIMFLGSNRDIWKDEISKLVPLDRFPQEFGGDGDNDKFYIERL